MTSIKHRALIRLRHLRHTVRPAKLPASLTISDMPYFAQWESPELVEKIIRGELSAHDDPNWKSSGAKTRREYLDWSWNMCGMACLKMVLAHSSKQTIPIITLGKQCQKHGGYTLPFETSNGLNYKAFVEFVAVEYGLHATIHSPLILPGIQLALSRGSYVIASVNPAIRNPLSSAPKSKGGHLVLVVGYDRGKKLLQIHNPSGNSDSQAFAQISYRDFEKFFAHRGIVISKH